MKSCSSTMVQVVWSGKFRVDYSWLRVRCLKFRMHRVCGLWVGYKGLEISVILYFVALLLRICNSVSSYRQRLGGKQHLHPCSLPPHFPPSMRITPCLPLMSSWYLLTTVCRVRVHYGEFRVAVEGCRGVKKPSKKKLSGSFPKFSSLMLVAMQSIILYCQSVLPWCRSVASVVKDAWLAAHEAFVRQPLLRRTLSKMEPSRSKRSAITFRACTATIGDPKFPVLTPSNVMMCWMVACTYMLVFLPSPTPAARNYNLREVEHLLTGPEMIHQPTFQFEEKQCQLCKMCEKTSQESHYVKKPYNPNLAYH